MIKPIVKLSTLFTILSILIIGCNNAGSTGTVNKPNLSTNNLKLHNSSLLTSTNQTMDTQWTVDGKSGITLNSQLHDLGWHLLTISVSKIGSNTQSTPVGGLQYVLQDQSRGQKIDFQDISCTNAIFSKVGDSCSTYFRLDYNHMPEDINPINFNVEIGTNSYPNIPNTLSFNSKIEPKISTINIRSIESIESRYLASSTLTTNSRHYHIILVQNASYNPITIANITSTNNTIFHIVDRVTGDNNDPIYGQYPECSLNNNTNLQQVNTLNSINDSCLLIYKSTDSGTSTLETSAITISHSAVEDFPTINNIIKLNEAYWVTCENALKPALDTAHNLCNNYAANNNLNLDTGTVNFNPVELSTDQSTCSMNTSANFYTVNPIYHTCDGVFSDVPQFSCIDKDPNVSRFFIVINAVHWGPVTQNSTSCSAAPFITVQCRNDANCTPKGTPVEVTCRNTKDPEFVYRSASQRGGERVEHGSRVCGTSSWPSTFITN